MTTLIMEVVTITLIMEVMMITQIMVDMMTTLKELSNGQVNSSYLKDPTNGHSQKLMANMQILQ